MMLRLLLAAVLFALAACAATPDEAEMAESTSETEKPQAAVPRAAPPAKVAVAPPVVPPPDPEASPPPKPQIHRAAEVETLLNEFERLRRLSATEVAREQEAARQAFNQSRSDAARVRFAMTMAVPGFSGNDEPRALDLLDPLVKNTAAPLHGLAFLMAAYIQEQRRLAAQLQGLQQSTQGLQQNVQALQQKLDALRSLERSLSEREAAGRRR